MKKAATKINWEDLVIKSLDKTLNEYSGEIINKIYVSPKNDYSVIIFKEKKTGETIKATCQYVADEETDITIYGEWEETEKWGRQFKSTSMKMDMQLSKNGLVKFLTKNTEIKGIGNKKAEKIVEMFGDNFDEIISNSPEIISENLNIDIETINNLAEVWKNQKTANQIATNLSEFPLSQKHIMELVRLYGYNAVKIVKDNPYFLIKILKSFGFKRADEIAMQTGVDPNSVTRKQACLEYILYEVENSGSCWIDIDFLINKMNKELTNVSWDNIQIFLQKEYDRTKVVIFADPYSGIIRVSSKKIYDEEKFIIDYIINNSESNEEMFDYANGITDEDLEKLNDDQKNAVLNSFKYNFSVITGKAGTGKTYVISKIVELCRRMGLVVACAAPTGKAARRMEEMTDYPASTIHRMLKYNGEHFEYCQDNQLMDYDVIVIDEFSMVSIDLGYNLLAALPINTKVIIVGDHNQLTAIGAGNIFNDILEYNKINEHKIDFKVSELSMVVRQAGNLKKNSVEILDGKISYERSDDWIASFTDKFEDENCLSDFIVELMTDTEKYTGGYKLDDVQLIVPMKKETNLISTYNLNKILQQSIQKKKYNNKIDIIKVHDKLYLHDKVIQMANDYQLEIMNGTIGKVSYISDTGEITINFEGGIVIEYQKNDEKLQNISLAYAMTTHKTQGSEYPCVVVVLHKSHYNMLNRNLLYTAVTRAKEKVIIIGDRQSIAIALSRNDTSDKQTNFMYHITHIRQ
jgi:exodeoxyribonuclease V alpha subunit